MSKTVEDWLSMGNTVTVLPIGFSGEFNKGWSNSINRNHNNKIATLTEIQEVNNWCKVRKGRAKEVCLVMDVSSGLLSQIFTGVRPCSLEKYKEIKKAIKAVEKNEQLKNNA